MLRKRDRTVGSTNFVTVDFNPRNRCEVELEFRRNGTYKRLHRLNAPSLRDFTEVCRYSVD